MWRYEILKTNLKVKLLAYTPEAEKVVSMAAKLCYSKQGIDGIQENLTDEKVAKYLAMIMSYNHESTIEHVSFTFGIEGVSRSLTHQLVRHRIASYSQKSQRYVSEGQFSYVVPPEIENDNEAYEKFILAMENIQKTYDGITEILKKKHYENYINSGVSEKKSLRDAEKKAIEDARFVLPNACETKIIVTMNARTLLHFFKERCCKRAQWEIRALAEEMLKEAKKVAPIIFKNAGPSCVNGICPEGDMSCGMAQEMKKKFREN